MNAMLKCKLAAVAIASVGVVSTASADTYEFTVDCSTDTAVVEWGVGDFDPGKEVLRDITSADYPWCKVKDYSDDDSELRRISYSQSETRARTRYETMGYLSD